MKFETGQIRSVNNGTSGPFSSMARHGTAPHYTFSFVFLEALGHLPKRLSLEGIANY